MNVEWYVLFQKLFMRDFFPFAFIFDEKLNVLLRTLFTTQTDTGPGTDSALFLIPRGVFATFPTVLMTEL